MRPHDEWLKKSIQDLKSAKRLKEGDEPLLDTAAYHTQQTVEKALKGFLAYHNKPLVKTHDLIELVDYCVEIDSEFKELYDMVDEINPYSTAFRYPGGLSEPEYFEVDVVIKYAEKILSVVKKKIDS